MIKTAKPVATAVRLLISVMAEHMV